MIELAPRTNFDMSFDDAFVYCITLYYNGYSDWRLPTHFEYCATHNLIMSWHEERYEKADGYAKCSVEERGVSQEGCST